MSEPFLGQIAIFGFNFAPRGWAFCDGQMLPIAQNQSLFSLLGTTYGGDGRQTFALPDLRGRTPLHPGDSSELNQLGERGGAETHTLSTSELPSHGHQANCQSGNGTVKTPAGHVPASEANGAIAVYGGPANATLNAGAVQNAGGGGAHDNMQPFLTLTFAIALSGVFPSRN